MRDSRDFHVPLGQALGQIVAGGIPLNVGTERDDDLVNPALGQAMLERVDAQFLRANAVHRGNLAAKHVIVTAKRARLFDIQNIDRPFHHAEHALVPRRVGADGAGRFFGQAAALAALDNLLPGLDEHTGQALGHGGFRLNQVKCQALCRARADAGQPVQLDNQCLERFGERGHGG